MKSIREIIGDNVKKYREAKGWTRGKLATHSFYQQGYIKELEAGNKNISVNMLENIAMALEVSIIDLVEYRDDE